MYIGVDIGGTKILVSAADGKLKPKKTLKIPSPARGSTALNHITSLITQAAGGGNIDAIAVSSAGPLDLKRGVISHPTNLHWRNTPVVKHLTRAFKVPVVLENDANAGAIAEHQLGAARGYNHVLYVTFSTGVGTGIILNNQIHHGAFDTEGGHIVIDPDGPVCPCGGRGHLEALVSGRSIEEKYGRIAADITESAIWDDIAANMAAGLVSFTSLLSPDVIVLAGGVSTHYDRFKKPLLRHFKRQYFQYPIPAIKTARFVETAPVYGCFLLAKKAHASAKKPQK